MTRPAIKSPQGADLVVAVWGLRLLLRRRGLLSHFHSEMFAGWELLGGDVPWTPRKVESLRPYLTDRLRRLEAVEVGRGDGVLRNADLLARRLGLTPLERDIVVLTVMMQSAEWLAGLFIDRQLDRYRDLLDGIACALTVNVAEVKRALRRDGVLRTTRLIELCGSRRGSNTSLEPADGLVEALSSAGLSSQALMRHFVREAPSTRLAIEDFGHVEADVKSLAQLLAGALRRRTKGVNVLLHGKPGTGKTELARVVSRAVGGRLYEVADADDDGDALDGGQRISMCAIAQRMLAQAGNALLLFDEIEDAFPTRWNGSLGLERSSTPTKAWTHRLLEQAPLPTFWVANTIEQIDAATLRRFDLVVELGVPPQTVRRRMIAAELGKRTVEAADLDGLAADERLAPAHVARAVRVAGLMGAKKPAALGATLSYVLERNLAAHGPARPALSANMVCGPYDPTFVNASADLGTLTAALTRTSQAAICLYGPPGTGKTAWVTHLAASLGRPLRVARASDLLDCWVGGTEKNIASVFRSALAEKAVLFIDEADSFLQERGRAKQSWEVTQVNELLVQMEAFQGMFICATNLVDTLDHASLRRFSLKIEFLPLRPEQRLAMWRRLASEPAAAGAACSEVEQLDGLTAGDFATVARQARLTGTESRPEELVAMLKRELVLRKGGTAYAIGFSRDART